MQFNSWNGNFSGQCRLCTEQILILKILDGYIRNLHKKQQ
uniref:Uncharacterized protein n=1 Tax=Arundo donax TaxID=35708 RepID=A0A0A8Y1W1_ARUDO